VSADEHLIVHLVAFREQYVAEMTGSKAGPFYGTMTGNQDPRKTGGGVSPPAQRRSADENLRAHPAFARVCAEELAS